MDVVIDLVAGPQWPSLLDVLRRGGRYATSGAIAGPVVDLDVRTLYLKDLTLVGATFQEPKVFENLIGYIERGEIRPLVHATYPLRDVAKAQEDFLGKNFVGKLVLLPPDSSTSGSAMKLQTFHIDGPAGPLQVHVQGQGPAVVLIPSLGRGARDFDLLAASLADAGYRAIRPEPSGIEGSALGPGMVTMDDLADDVATVIRATVKTPPMSATVVGHAFGNRVARMVATRYPELVESVVLLASGGKIPPSAEAATALSAVFDTSLSSTDHLAAVRTALF